MRKGSGFVESLLQVDLQTRHVHALGEVVMYLSLSGLHVYIYANVMSFITRDSVLLLERSDKMRHNSLIHSFKGLLSILFDILF